MILPWIRGFLSFEKAPFTWLLVFLNVFFFLLFAEDHKKIEFLQRKQNLQLTGKYYHQYLTDQNVFTKLPASDYQWSLLGARGFRDEAFIEEIPNLKLSGDAIEFENWKLQTFQFQQALKKRNSWVFGLHSESKNSLAWITYQFVHANFLHLFSNMAMLLIFGTALEVMLGGWVLCSLYFIFGVFGGLGYFALSNNASVPVIGASAAVTGLVLFYMLFEKRPRVAFFYFVSPLEGHFGMIFLSKWFLIPLLFVSDFKDLFASPDELLNQVAVSAHIGGLLGALLLFFVISGKTAAQSIFAHRSRL